MIQRIQTIFLLAAGILLTVMLYFPLGKLIYPEGKTLLMMAGGLYDGQRLVFPFSFLQLMLTTCAIISISIIIYFKKRVIQMRFCIYNMVLIILTASYQLYYWMQCIKLFAGTSSRLFIPFIFPLIAIILLYLAYRAIKKDDDLIKSVDRIR